MVFVLPGYVPVCRQLCSFGSQIHRLPPTRSSACSPKCKSCLCHRRAPQGGDGWRRASTEKGSAFPPLFGRQNRSGSRLTVRPPERLFHPVLESHDGRALVPIPKRSTSPRATSTLWWWMV